MRFAATASILALMLSLTGCEDQPACTDEGLVLDGDGNCVPRPGDDGGTMDGGGDDGGPDAGGDGGDVDGGPCDPACTGAEICRDDGECVECLGMSDCAGASGGPHCDPDGACVECLTDGDCTSATAAQCDSGSCVPCALADHCMGVTGADVCDTTRAPATCVECTVGSPGACSASETCNLVTGGCVGVAAGDVAEECLPCTNDLQCAGDMKCIELDYMGSLHGAYCLRRGDTGTPCRRPIATTITNPTSINGAALTGVYCSINEMLTTCEAARAMDAAWQCNDVAVDGRCIEPGVGEVAVPGALCENFGANGLLCTVQCGENFQCDTTGLLSECTATSPSVGHCSTP